jgi:hypothetical protein
MKIGIEQTVLLCVGLLSGAAAAEEKQSEASAGADAKQDTTEKEAETNAAGSSKKKRAAPIDDARRSALNAHILLKVANPDEAHSAIKKETERLKGFLSYTDDARVTVKVPPGALSSLMTYAAEQGYLIEKTLAREDLTREIAELEGRLKSKTEILARLRRFFNDSDVAATLEIEQTMTGLVLEIESVRGRLRYLNNRADWAVLDISFQFRERDRIVYIQSPFEWLNTASLDHFIEEF